VSHIAREIWLDAGLDPHVPALTVVQQCATSLAAATHVPELDLVTYRTRLRGWALPLTRLSDNASFWDRRYPSLMITDTAFLRNPNYHTEWDRADTLDYGFMKRVAQAVLAAVIALAA
jgi:hypothetical protein